MASQGGDDAAAVALVRRRKVLIAVDESDESIYALSWALENLIVPGRPNDAEEPRVSNLVILLHVQTHPQVFVGPAGPGFYITPEIIDSVKKHQEEISRKVLLRAKKLCDEKHLETETMVAVGDPRDAICEAVEKLAVDYLVIGSHGYGAIKRTFLGSVSDYCAHKAKCPVVIVKKK
ncbi:hypothetical protein KP509_13G093900 [Ceratopteris richardii]|uniref:UspA domain-containing protein n=1 Tax=Ceratopteris richardii TaxID=49495 RepID=A0A8T2TK86_CERRI|nr:hypothetical protein KP509_13G093900 [Ceratopteris richardii]